MKLYELEISNYKCLENYGMPLKFGNLNFLIGENDSGKSALLEVIQMLFIKKKIEKSCFYDFNKEIKIKVRLHKINKKILKDVMDFNYQIQVKNDEYDWPDIQDEVIEFEKAIEILKEKSFYKDLYEFYINYLEEFTVVHEDIFKINDSNKVELSKVNLYFSNPVSYNKSLTNLLNNSDFNNFMMSYFTKIKQDIEKAEKYEEFDLGGFDFIMSDLTSDGVTEEKIVYKILKIINSKLDKKFNWDIEYYFDFEHPLISYFSPYETDSSESSRRLYKDLFSSIFLGKIVDKIEYRDFKRNSGILFLGDYEKDSLNNLLEEIYEYLDSCLNKYLIDKIKTSNNENYFNELKNQLNILLSNLEKRDINLKFNFSLNRFQEIQKLLEPTLKISAVEGGREIEIANRSQGFLRKLLMCDFLLLTDKLSNTLKNGRLILVEEPEVHMHVDAQRTIINKLKENLINSNSQVFITTHSESIIEDINFENIYIFYRDKNSGISKITNINQYSDNSNILFELQRSLGLSKMQLLNYKKVAVLVEGKRDIVFIESLCKKPELKINLERILFIPVNGQENMDHYIKSDLIANFLGFKILVVLDNNEINEKRKKKLLKNTDVVDVILVNKQDILDFIDVGIVEEYYNIKRGTLKYDKNKDKLEKVVKNRIRKAITSEDIEEMVLRIKDIPTDLKKVVEKIKFIQDTYVEFNF